MNIRCAVFAVIALFLTANAAEAKRHHTYHHHKHRLQHIDRGPTVAVGAFYDNDGHNIQPGPIERTSDRRNASRVAYYNTTGTTELIAKARAYSGMTARQIGLRRTTQWCMAFLRYIGLQGPIDDRAISALRLHRVSAQIGAIAVYPHHVGIVTGFDGHYPVIISGNSYQRRVYEGIYPRTPIAYVAMN